MRVAADRGRLACCNCRCCAQRRAVSLWTGTGAVCVLFPLTADAAADHNIVGLVVAGPATLCGWRCGAWRRCCTPQHGAAHQGPLPAARCRAAAEARVPATGAQHGSGTTLWCAGGRWPHADHACCCALARCRSGWVIGELPNRSGTQGRRPGSNERRVGGRGNGGAVSVAAGVWRYCAPARACSRALVLLPSANPCPCHLRLLLTGLKAGYKQSLSLPAYARPNLLNSVHRWERSHSGGSCSWARSGRATACSFPKPIVARQPPPPPHSFRLGWSAGIPPGLHVGGGGLRSTCQGRLHKARSTAAKLAAMRSAAGPRLSIASVRPAGRAAATHGLFVSLTGAKRSQPSSRMRFRRSSSLRVHTCTMTFVM